MQLKEFPSRQAILDKYNFPNEQQSQDIGTCWFFVPLETQLANFVNGLGRIYYSTTLPRDIEKHPYGDNEPEEVRKPYYRIIVTDFVLIKELVHDHSCRCAKCDISPAEMIKLEGFEDCYIGCGISYAEYPAVAYDSEKIIEKLMTEKALNRQEAEIYFHDNIFLDYKGEKMPIFISKPPYNEI